MLDLEVDKNQDQTRIVLRPNQGQIRAKSGPNQGQIMTIINQYRANKKIEEITRSNKLHEVDLKTKFGQMTPLTKNSSV